MKQYNDPSYYRVKRKELGHGQGRNMNPGLMESYGDRSFRGFRGRINEGRNYEENIGYRKNYDSLGTGPTLDYETPAEIKIQNRSGKGLRSYQRKDERILEDINDRMCDNPYLDATEIDVSVQKGEVILTGVVEDRKSKLLAEDIGESVSGVKNVENRLRIRLRGI